MLASRYASSSFALFIALNLVFLALTDACGATCPTPTPTPTPPSPKPPKPTPSPSPTGGKCPMDTLKLGVCANVLGGLINLNIGSVPKKPCCSLIGNLVDLEAAVCLCTAIRANILGISLNVPVDLSLLLNVCGKKVPEGFKCA